ncbi:MAG: NUDIX hydrolase [Saprospiraceae bacterium]|nr:NUDIX hydrolase [Saprospiraceae bacterium]
MPLPWFTEQSVYLFQRPPYLTVRKDTVVLPNGARIDDYFVLEYPDWVVSLALTEDGHFVCIRQYRHGIGDVHFELPAGVADPGEPLLDCARRELLEETGYGGGVWRPWIVASANPGTHNNRAHVFLATGVARIAEPALDATEDISVHILSPADMRRTLEHGGVSQAIHQAALWRYLYEKPDMR